MSTGGATTLTADNNYLLTGDSFTLTCALPDNERIIINRPGDQGVNCGSCLVDNPTGFLGQCQDVTTATYIVDCVWCDTGTMIFSVEHTSDMEFGTWVCGEAGIPLEELTGLDIQRFGDN